MTHEVSEAFDVAIKPLKRRMINATLMAFSMILISVPGCKKQAPPAKGNGFPPARVVVVDVVAQDVPEYIDENGRISAFRSVLIKPQVTGKIININFEEGKDVKKGQPLFEIEPAPYEAVLAQAKAQLQQNEAQLVLAKADFERIRDLPRTVVPQGDYDAKVNAVSVGVAQVEAAKAAIEAAKINLAYCHVAADIDGVVGQRMVDPGNVVIANNPMGASSVMVSIQQVDKVYADFSVPESELSRLRQNMTEGKLKVEVRLPQETHAHLGEMSFLDNMVSEASSTIKLRAEIPNDNRHFWPGQFVYVRLILNVKKGATLVPTSSVQIGQDGKYVYVVDADSKAELRPVEQGQLQGDLRVILSGLKAGERVISKGQMMVMPGGPVTIVPDQPGTASTQSAATQTASTQSASTHPVQIGTTRSTTRSTTIGGGK